MGASREITAKTSICKIAPDKSIKRDYEKRWNEFCVDEIKLLIALKNAVKMKA